MKLHIEKDAVALGNAAAALTAVLLRQVIKEKGEARVVLSTGSSRFETLEALIK